MAANGPETDSHFEVMQPRLRRLFYEASGEAMAVDAFQLEPILNCMLRDDHRSPYSMVCCLLLAQCIISKIMYAFHFAQYLTEKFIQYNCGISIGFAENLSDSVGSTGTRNQY